MLVLARLSTASDGRAINKLRVYLAEAMDQDREGGTCPLLMDLAWGELELLTKR
jgi:hypothetical protein